jgi:hypothetical protein
VLFVLPGDCKPLTERVVHWELSGNKVHLHSVILPAVIALLCSALFGQRALEPLHLCWSVRLSSSFRWGICLPGQ